MLTEEDGGFDLSWKHVLDSCPPGVVEFLDPEARVVLLWRLKVWMKPPTTQTLKKNNQKTSQGPLKKMASPLNET